MRATLRLWATLCVLALGMFAQKPNKPDFSGTWQLDLQRTRFGEIPQPKSMVLQIDHREPEIQIISTTTTNNGDVRETFKLTTDGKQYAHGMQGQSCMAKAQWFWWEGRRLVVEVNCADHSLSRRFTLGPTGKILTAVLTVKDRSGEKKAYEFFLRQ